MRKGGSQTLRRPGRGDLLAADGAKATRPLPVTDHGATLVTGEVKAGPVPTLLVFELTPN